MKTIKTTHGRVTKDPHNGYTNFATYSIASTLDNYEPYYLEKLVMLGALRREVDAYEARRVTLAIIGHTVPDAPDSPRPGERFQDINFDELAEGFSDDLESHRETTEEE